MSEFAILARASPLPCKLTPKPGFRSLCGARSLGEGRNVVRKRLPLPCSLALKTFVVNTFKCVVYAFELAEGFVAVACVCSRQPLGFFSV